jgi:hypothetical protein
MGKYIRLVIFGGLIIACLLLIAWGCEQSKRIGNLTGEKATINESLEQSLKEVSSLEGLLSARELRSRQDERTIAALRGNLRESEEHNRRLRTDIDRLRETNREFERLERERLRRAEEGERIFEEFRVELERLGKEIKAIPIMEMD